MIDGEIRYHMDGSMRKLEGGILYFLPAGRTEEEAQDFMDHEVSTSSSPAIEIVPQGKYQKWLEEDYLKRGEGKEPLEA